MRNAWNKEKAAAVALQYTDYAEFKTKETSAHRAIYRYKWHDLLTHMHRTTTLPDYWTTDKVMELAKQCLTRGEFFSRFKSAYLAARRLGVFEEACSHMKGVYPYFWDEENIQQIARKYASRTAFLKGNAGAYSAAKRLGILEQVCSHMQLQGSKYARGIYAIEFEDQSVYVGLTYNFDTRLKHHQSKNTYIGKKLKTTTYEFKVVSDYMPVEKAVEAEEIILQNYAKQGWVILNRNKTGGLGAGQRIYTEIEVLRLAQSFSDLAEFMKTHPAAYVVAHRNGWDKTAFAHLNRKVEHGRWSTFEKVDSEAKKYSRRVDFFWGSPGAYNKARQAGWLETACQHMEDPKRHNYWDKETILQAARDCSPCTLTVFRKQHGGAYNRARKLGLLNSLREALSENVVK